MYVSVYGHVCVCVCGGHVCVCVGGMCLLVFGGHVCVSHSMFVLFFVCAAYNKKWEVKWAGYSFNPKNIMLHMYP